jgi:hypothetical protein
MDILPEYLYRGDRDFKKIRNLRETITGYQLLTNLINGGNGREIIETPLINLINKHVSTDWKATHFLSFTEKENISLRFGLHCEIEEIDNKMPPYNEYCENDNDWDFVIITIDTNKINWSPINNGVYHGSYLSSRALNTSINNEIILMDVKKILKDYDGHETSKINSDRDEEWLIWPSNKAFQNGFEYSAIFDINYIVSQIQTYKKNYSKSIF